MGVPLILIDMRVCGIIVFVMVIFEKFKLQCICHLKRRVVEKMHFYRG